MRAVLLTSITTFIWVATHMGHFRTRFVVPHEDVRSVIHAILRHRLIISYDALADHVRPDDIIDELLRQVAVG